MNTKEWLCQGKHLNKEIKALKSALSQAESFNLSCPNQNNNNCIERLNAKISQLSKTNSDILSAIYKIDNTILRTLLIERFINNRTWERVSILLGYDFYHVIKRLYPKAIAEVEKFR